MNEYKLAREKLLKIHYENSFGSDEILTENEEKFNKILMALKKCEVFRGFKNPSDFNPMHHFLEVHEKINESKLFKIIRSMPKGAVLHTHDGGLGSADCMVSLTHWPNLWQSGEISDDTMFKFSTKKPGPEWLLVADERLKMGAKNYDKTIRKLFTLLVENPSEAYRVFM
jgi:adenosine deaminase CECR1